MQICFTFCVNTRTIWILLKEKDKTESPPKLWVGDVHILGKIFQHGYYWPHFLPFIWGIEIFQGYNFFFSRTLRFSWNTMKTSLLRVVYSEWFGLKKKKKKKDGSWKFRAFDTSERSWSSSGVLRWVWRCMGKTRQIYRKDASVTLLPSVCSKTLPGSKLLLHS